MLSNCGFKGAWLLVVLALSACAFGEKGEVRVGVFPMRPQNFMDEEGVARGLNPDLLRKIAESADWTPVFVPVTWAEGLEKLESGEIDLMPSVSYSEARGQTLDYSTESVMDVWGRVYVLADSGIVSSLDLVGLSVGIVRADINGQNFNTLIRALGVECVLVEFDTHSDVFDAIQRGNITAGVAPNHFGRGHSRNNEVVGTSIQFSPAPIFFAAKKGRVVGVLKDIDSALARWRVDPESFYYASLGKWFDGEVPAASRLPGWGWVLIVAIAVATTFSLFLNWLFNREVKARTAALGELSLIHI